MYGFGDDYWREIIWEDLIEFCVNNNIAFDIDEEFCHNIKAAGVFQHKYQNKEAVSSFNAKVISYNKSLKYMKNLLPEKYNHKEYEPLEEGITWIKLDGKGKQSFWTFIHEAGHYFQYAKNLEFTEEGADRFRLEYFKSLPKWLSFLFRESIPIFSGIDEKVVYEELGLHKWEYPYYGYRAAMCKKLHQAKKYIFHSLLTDTII